MLHSTGHLQQAQLKIEKQNFNNYSHIAYNTGCYYESTIVKQIIFKPFFLSARRPLHIFPVFNISI